MTPRLPAHQVMYQLMHGPTPLSPLRYAQRLPFTRAPRAATLRASSVQRTDLLSNIINKPPFTPAPGALTPYGDRDNEPFTILTHNVPGAPARSHSGPQRSRTPKYDAPGNALNQDRGLLLSLSKTDKRRGKRTEFVAASQMERLHFVCSKSSILPVFGCIVICTNRDRPTPCQVCELY